MTRFFAIWFLGFIFSLYAIGKGCHKTPPKPPVEIVVGQLPDGVIGQPYFYQLKVTGGTPPYHCSLGGGALPRGLIIGHMDDNGQYIDDCVITGTPLEAGTFRSDIGTVVVKPKKT